VVINDLHIFRVCIRPPKAITPLIVDSNAVLAGTLAFESLEAIAGRHLQVIQPASDFKLPQLAPRHFGDIYEPPDMVAFGERLGIRAL
jgi:hypothetical protein